jgi:hypothetical protein
LPSAAPARGCERALTNALYCIQWVSRLPGSSGQCVAARHMRTSAVRARARLPTLLVVLPTAHHTPNRGWQHGGSAATTRGAHNAQRGTKAWWWRAWHEGAPRTAAPPLPRRPMDGSARAARCQPADAPELSPGAPSTLNATDSIVTPSAGVLETSGVSGQTALSALTVRSNQTTLCERAVL